MLNLGEQIKFLLNGWEQNTIAFKSLQKTKWREESKDSVKQFNAEHTNCHSESHDHLRFSDPSYQWI